MSLRADAFNKQNLLACTGYASRFVNNTADIALLSTLPMAKRADLPLVEGNPKRILHYNFLSVLYNARRRVPFLSAYNIDGNEKVTVQRTGFEADPRIDIGCQLGPAFYDLRKDITEFEIGHMAANNEMAWGVEGQLQSYRTFFFPNSVPQAERLNTGIWKTLESYIIDEAAAAGGNKKIAVFTGPVLKDNDPAYSMDRSFQLPLSFFKVIVFEVQGQLYSKAFIMSHAARLKELNLFAASGMRGITIAPPGYFDDFPYRKVFQVNLPLLEKETGLKFSWPQVKRISLPKQVNQLEQIGTVKDTKDAAALSGTRGLTRGAAPGKVDDGKVKLNIIMPGD